MTAQEIINLIYPASAAHFFNVNKSSELYKKVERVAETIEARIKDSESKVACKSKNV